MSRKATLSQATNAEIAAEINRRMTRTEALTDEQLLSELRARIEHLDQPECYAAYEIVGRAERDSMIAIEVCDAVEHLLNLSAASLAADLLTNEEA